MKCSAWIGICISYSRFAYIEAVGKSRCKLSEGSFREVLGRPDWFFALSTVDSRW